MNCKSVSNQLRAVHMNPSHFHALSRNLPLSRFSIELDPLSLTQFDRSHEGVEHQPHGDDRRAVATIGGQASLEITDLLRRHRLTVIDLGAGQGTFECCRRITICTEGDHCMAKYCGTPLPELHGIRFGTTSLHLLKDFQQMRSGHLANREPADFWEGIALQATGCLFEVVGRPLGRFSLKPFTGDRLERIGAFVDLPDPFRLLLLGGVDALFDQLANTLAFAPGFGQCYGGIFTDGVSAVLFRCQPER